MEAIQYCRVNYKGTTQIQYGNKKDLCNFIQSFVELGECEAQLKNGVPPMAILEILAPLLGNM
jgi:hypothetical protein